VQLLQHATFRHLLPIDEKIIVRIGSARHYTNGNVRYPIRYPTYTKVWTITSQTTGRLY
jgi:hypothetical protein